MLKSYWLSARTSALVALALGVFALGACGQDEPVLPDAMTEFTTEQAEALYVAQCVNCHARDGSGAVGPPIGDGVANEKYTREEMIAQVRDGLNAMPGFSDRLSESEMAAIVDYVRNDLKQLEPSADPSAEPPPSADGTGSSDPSESGEDGEGTAAVSAIPPELAGTAWPLPNRDHFSSRATTDSPINVSNVKQLEEVWRYQVPGGDIYGNITTALIIINDVIYFQERTGVVHAVDLTTGKGIWKAGDPNAGTMFGPNGVAVGWGKVFSTKIGPRGRGELVVAYDINTGEELWASDITGGRSELNIQPFPHGGLVFASSSGFPAGERGTIYALDQATGSIVWQFATVEDEGLWGNPEVNSGGGAWYPPSLDPETGTLYYGIGNPYPFPGIPGYPAGASRPGDNRWTNSTVALDAATGELRWGFQAFPHDIFDRDHVLTAIAEIPADGQAADAETADGQATRKMVISTGKGAVVFGLDPATGEELWQTPVGKHQNDELTSFDETIEVFPGVQGGIVTPIATADGVAYVTVLNAPTVYNSDEDFQAEQQTSLFTNPSNVVAIDAATGEILWDAEVTAELVGATDLFAALDWAEHPDLFGGMTVVNDLLFTATYFGQLLAFDRFSGNLVWVHQASSSVNGWPAVSGDMIVFPIGQPSEIAGTIPHLVAFKLADLA